MMELSDIIREAINKGLSVKFDGDLDNRALIVTVKRKSDGAAPQQRVLIRDIVVNADYLLRDAVGELTERLMTR